ncbi:MAG: glycosyltransferase family 4 protein [archaeon]|jgi:glycosyltransferase involved in cell wall biosynthesis|nr:glycosyltransferase family 4 protein [archaeon]
MSSLALFFTGGVSLKDWERFRNLDRELRRHEEFGKYFQHMRFFTYGNSEDFSFNDRLPSNLTVYPKKWNVSSKLYSFLLPFAYRKEIQGSTILKTNQMNGSWAAVIAKKLYGGKLVVRSGFEWLRFCQFKKRSKIMLFFIRLLENFSYKNADAIILPSQEDKDFVVDTFHIEESKVALIPNHIDIEFFRPMAVQKEEGRITAVVRLEKQKNIFAAIEAVAGLPHVKLVLFGSGSLKEELEAFAKKSGSNVEFRGSVLQEQLPEELNKSQLFIQSSFFEGSPKSLLEAMSVGLPCIGTNVPGINNVIVHGQNGYLCGTDADSMRKAITEVLRDKELQERMGVEARKTIEYTYSFEKIYQQELRLLQSL